MPAFSMPDILSPSFHLRVLCSMVAGVGSGGSSGVGHNAFGGGQTAYGNVETPAAAFYTSPAAGLSTGETTVTLEAS